MGRHSLEENNVDIDAELDAIINSTDSNDNDDLVESEADSESTSVDIPDLIETVNESLNVDDVQDVDFDNSHASDKEDEENTTSDTTDDDSNDVLSESQEFVDSYFAEDEAFLAGDDRVLDESQKDGVVLQSDNVIRWRVDNLYTKNGNFKHYGMVRANPPVLTIESSDNDEVSFVLSREFASQMESVMKDVRRAYAGDPFLPSPPPTRKMSDEDRASKKSWWSRAKTWASEHKVKAGFLIVIGGYLALAVSYAFLQVIIATIF